MTPGTTELQSLEIASTPACAAISTACALACNISVSNPSSSRARPRSKTPCGGSRRRSTGPPRSGPERLANLPKPTYPEELPVVQRRDEIARAIAENQVIVLCGETGSGKTTQLPKICLELGRGVAGMIGHTQPRRIAARSVAMRIAQELDSPLGHAVGYKVRFSDQTRRRRTSS